MFDVFVGFSVELIRDGIVSVLVVPEGVSPGGEDEGGVFIVVVVSEDDLVLGFIFVGWLLVASCSHDIHPFCEFGYNMMHLSVRDAESFFDLSFGFALAVGLPDEGDEFGGEFGVAVFAEEVAGFSELCIIHEGFFLIKVGFGEARDHGGAFGLVNVQVDEIDDFVIGFVHDGGGAGPFLKGPGTLFGGEGFAVLVFKVADLRIFSILEAIQG